MGGEGDGGPQLHRPPLSRKGCARPTARAVWWASHRLRAVRGLFSPRDSFKVLPWTGGQATSVCCRPNVVRLAVGLRPPCKNSGHCTHLGGCPILRVWTIVSRPARDITCV